MHWGTFECLIKPLADAGFSLCSVIGAYGFGWHLASPFRPSQPICSKRYGLWGILKSLGSVSYRPSCNKSQITWPPFSPHFPKSSQILSCIHTNIMSPFPNSFEGAFHIICFINKASRICSILTISHNLAAFSCFKKYKATSENLFENKIKFLRSDRGGSYTSAVFVPFLSAHGISFKRAHEKNSWTWFFCWEIESVTHGITPRNLSSRWIASKIMDWDCARNSF